VVALKIFENPEERKIGLGRCFVKPLEAMRPRAVIDDIG